ncbi:hypothetical protein FN846DRAFT_968331 [Sphaerosporella brunnea]|uniref:Uncharacterized protein n=1 Tax=Sphaerosporella brunnea TaxID=1250544 RepID=A0A5J5EL04_9PEZI|nr:hypothetical protein FN846DRAFT_968331 [Sphaerosporella brunnea]
MAARAISSSENYSGEMAPIGCSGCNFLSLSLSLAESLPPKTKYVLSIILLHTHMHVTATVRAGLVTPSQENSAHNSHNSHNPHNSHNSKKKERELFLSSPNAIDSARLSPATVPSLRVFYGCVIRPLLFTLLLSAHSLLPSPGCFARVACFFFFFFSSASSSSSSASASASSSSFSSYSCCPFPTL